MVGLRHLCAQAYAVVEMGFIAAAALQQRHGAQDGCIGDERDAAAAARLHQGRVRPRSLLAVFLRCARRADWVDGPTSSDASGSMTQWPLHMATVTLTKERCRGIPACSSAQSTALNIVLSMLPRARELRTSAHMARARTFRPR